MSNRNTAAVSIFIYIVWTLVALVTASLADSNTYWLLVDTTPEAQAHQRLLALNQLLTTRGKVPSEQIHHVEGENATAEEIQALLQEIGQRIQPKNTLILLYHGRVTKPGGLRKMHLLTYGDGEDGIQDTTLNAWLRETNSGNTFVIIDGYTEDTNLSTYFANRETFGTAALNIIQPAKTSETTKLLQRLYDALISNTSDLDENRQISIFEIYEHLRTRFDLVDGILVPTGNIEAPLLKLSPALKITTTPKGAQISINDVEVGNTPKLITENLQRGISKVSVKKNGYIIPSPKTAELHLVPGESVHIRWVLEPIAIYGNVKNTDGTTTEGTVIWIEKTAYQQLVAPDDFFRFHEWQDTNPLVLGETYTVYAKQAHLNYGSATFTFDGYTHIERQIQLVKKTWFEVAQIEFDRDNHQGAVTAFQNGIEETTDFPQMSPDLTILLLSYFAGALANQDVQGVTYLLVTAKLAEQHDQLPLAKKYWKAVKTEAPKGTPAAKLAGQRLWYLNRGTYLLNGSLIVLLIVVVISGAWTFYRYRKFKQAES